MNNQSPKNLPPYPHGVVHDLINEVKLIIRLLKDKRINFLLKVLPFGSAIYFISPDLVPGPVDDAFLIWLFAYLFVELCPPEIVAEHRQKLNNVIEGEWHDLKKDEDTTEVIDGEFHPEDEIHPQTK